MKATMRTIYFSIIALFSLSLTEVKAQVKETETESKITEVTVFFTGSQITRKASLALNPGTNIIRLSGLSYHLDPNSIQVEGNNKYTIVSVNHRHNFLEDADQLPEVKPLKEQSDKLVYDIELNKIEMNSLNEERMMIEANKQFIGQEKAVTVDDVMDMSELYQQRYKEINTQMVELNRKDKELTKKLKEINRQLSQVRQESNRYTSDILINISCAARTATDITVKYVTTNAGWVPSYDAKAGDIKAPLGLSYKAKVFQNTGEEWKNVKLTLSTGNPSKNNNLPVLGSWEISGYDYAEAERRRKEEEKRYNQQANARKKSAERSGEGAYPSAAQKSEDVQEQSVTIDYEADKTVSTATYTTVQQTSVNTEFAITIPYTIASDGKEYTVEIQQHSLDVKYRYYAAPKYDNAAFLVGYISGWDKLNLISGMANVYFLDSYVGQSYFNTQSTLDSVELSLGRDKSIMIERKKIKDYAKPSLSGATKKVTLGIEIVVKNTRNAAITLDLEDQYPVSRNKEIEVELVEDAGATVKKETGSLKWVLELNAGETKTIRFAYSVKYPKDRDIANF